MKDPEIEALATICTALQSLPDPESRERVLSYAAGRFNLKHSVPLKNSLPPTLPRPGEEKPASSNKPQSSDSEIVGIAKLTDAGELRITVRDLKATSRNDAAIRLSHVVILANERLKGEKQASSPALLVPILKLWRVYDGNTRACLAAQKGIIREGELLSLDQHARTTAEQYIAEILNGEVSGKWNPGASSSKTKRKASPNKG